MDGTNCTEIAPPNDGFRYCPSSMDIFQTCWNYTRAGTETTLPCPTIFKSDAFATRRCKNNAEWYTEPEGNNSWIDFNSCIPKVLDVHLVFVYFVGYSLSILCLIISLIIFFCFKQLQCDRVILHKNLFSCYLINAIVWLIFYSVVPNVDVITNNSVYCQIFFVVATYFSVGTYFWMFSEGLYLAVIMIVTFHHGSKFLIFCSILGWGIPFVLTMTYAITRYLMERPNECWITKSNFGLILTIPIFVALVANLLILLFIVKILITKLRHPTTREECQWRKTVRAVFLLIPLFGIQNIIFCINSEGSRASVIQDYITGVTTSFQGVIVSFTLCFFNGEVKSILSRRASQNRILHPSKSSRRGTYSTEITSLSHGRGSIGLRTLSIQSSVITKQ